MTVYKFVVKVYTTAAVVVEKNRKIERGQGPSQTYFTSRGSNSLLAKCVKVKRCVYSLTSIKELRCVKTQRCGETIHDAPL